MNFLLQKDTQPSTSLLLYRFLNFSNKNFQVVSAGYETLFSQLQSPSLFSFEDRFLESITLALFSPEAVSLHIDIFFKNLKSNVHEKLYGESISLNDSKARFRTIVLNKTLDLADASEWGIIDVHVFAKSSSTKPIRLKEPGVIRTIVSLQSDDEFYRETTTDIPLAASPVIPKKKKPTKSTRQHSLPPNPNTLQPDFFQRFDLTQTDQRLLNPSITPDGIYVNHLYNTSEVVVAESSDDENITNPFVLAQKYQQKQKQVVSRPVVNRRPEDISDNPFYRRTRAT
jgi:hypothetical protein